MIDVIVNSKFEYLIPLSGKDDKVIVNIEDTTLKDWLIASLKDDNVGLSNAPCLLTKKTLFITASEKLQRKYNPEWQNDFNMSEEEIEKQDNEIYKKNAS